MQSIEDITVPTQVETKNAKAPLTSEICVCSSIDTKILYNIFSM